MANYCRAVTKSPRGTGMFIPDPDPDFYPSRIPDLGSRIPDPKTAMKDIGKKNLLSYLFFGVINFTKLNYFIFKMLKKKIWANFQRIIELFTQKIVSKLSKIWVWDPGSEIQDPGSGKNLFRIPDPGVKKAPDPGSATLIRNLGLDPYSIVTRNPCSIVLLSF
jgi:hypothetical protein